MQVVSKVFRLANQQNVCRNTSTHRWKHSLWDVVPSIASLHKASPDVKDQGVHLICDGEWCANSLMDSLIGT